MSVPPKWEHVPLALLLPTKGVLVPPLREFTLPSVPRLVLVQDHSQSPCPRSYPWYALGLPKPPGHGYLHNADSDLMHHQYRLFSLFCSGTQVQHAEPPPRLMQPLVGRFHEVILQEASDNVLHVSDHFIAYTGNTDLAILLNKDTFETNPAVYAFPKASSSKDRWRMVLLVVRGLLRRPSLSVLPQSRSALSTSTMLLPRNVERHWR